MHPFARGSLVLFGFLGLALGPLAVVGFVSADAGPRSFLAELAAAAGYVAFALYVLEFALVARIRWVCEPFGNDALALFHRQVGFVALGSTLAHVLLLAGPGAVRWSALSPFAGPWPMRFGALALFAALVLVVTSAARRGLALPYEPWRIAHRVLALAIVTGMLLHAFLAAPPERGPLVRAALLAYAALFLAILVHHRLVRPLWLLRRPWTVVENLDAGGSTRLLRLQPAGHAGFVFEAGQFAWLITGRSPFSIQQHPLSIASSAARPGALEFAVKALGDWSGTTVPALAPGARVWLDGPHGAFVPERAPASGFVLVAGGIGITPMRSVVLTLRDRDDRRPVLVLHAARNRARAVFQAELDALARSGAIQLVSVYEEGDARPEVERGLVTEALLRRHLPPGFERRAFFVCGPGPMMDAVEHALLRIGVARDRIHSERFDLV